MAELGLVYHEIPPLWAPDSRVLILGSIPSPRSRETGFYYGHPRNRFWKTVAAVFGEAVPETIEEKKALMLKHRLALWDVLQSCYIRGASDGSIKDPVPNDIRGLMGKTEISRIFTTGEKADRLYMKLVYQSTGLRSERLPSTSPANCAVSDAELVRAYERIII